MTKAYLSFLFLFLFFKFEIVYIKGESNSIPEF